MNRISARSVPRETAVLGVGGYLPGPPVRNEDIEATTGIEAKWIEDMTGIVSRHWASTEESVVSMAVEAGRDAMEGAELDPGQVDLVILASCTMKRPLPGGAATVAHRLGVSGAGAYDIVAACSGFTHALELASNAVSNGNVRNVLIVGSEKLTDWTSPDTPDVFTIFGDGAGAAIVGLSDDPGIGRVAQSSDGSRSSVLQIPDASDLIQMKGALVYKWATAVVPDLAVRACQNAGVELDDIAWIVPHQANQRIIDRVAETLCFPLDRVAKHGRYIGNTSAASIPLAVAALTTEGAVDPGDQLLLLGFGAGLSCAGQVIALPHR